MPSWDSFLSLLLSALAVMGSPGPATISVAAVGAAFGPRRALPYSIGLMIGTIAVLLAIALGLTAALLAIPGLAPVLVIGAALYILYLAWKIATAPPLAALDPAAAAPPLWGGVALGVANPKAWVAIAAVFGASRLSDAPVWDAVEKTVVLTALIVLIQLVWLAAGAAFAGALHDPVRSRIVNVVLAIALVGFAVLAVVPRH